MALRGQAFPLPPRESVGAALPEAASADVDPRRRSAPRPCNGAPSIAIPTSAWARSLGPTCDLWDFYADEAAKHGYQAGPENFGYLMPTVVAETEEKAQELAEGFVYGGGQNAFSAPQYTMPPGYNSKAAIRALAKQPTGSWLGVSGEKMSEQMHGRDSQEVDYKDVHRKLVRRTRQGQAQLPGNSGNPEDGDA